MSATRDPKARRGYRFTTGDYYNTPSWCTRRILEQLFGAYYRGESSSSPGPRWLEPGCGSGAIIDATDTWCRAQQRRTPIWTGIELHAHASSTLQDRVSMPWYYPATDYLAWAPRCTQAYDVALGNPPYSLAMDFVEQTTRLAQLTVFLLRVAFITSASRAEFMRAHPPDVYPLPQRPSFTGDGKTDSADYAWFVWDKARPANTPGRVLVLPLTSAEERAAG